MSSPDGGGRERAKAAQSIPNGPIPFDGLCAEAKRAWDDFEFFSRRYFGHLLSFWQVEAAVKIVELLESDEKEFVVINTPPGVGKTAQFCLRVPAWLTVRNRAIRGLIGGHKQKLAEGSVGRLRRALERTVPEQARDRDIKLGLAVDAEACLAVEYGLFRPVDPDIWRRDQFTVDQGDDQVTSEKESTWTAFGMDSSHLGWRIDYGAWDDVHTPRHLRSIEVMENLFEWWDNEAENRLDPGGVLVVPQQRLGPGDISRHCLNKVVLLDEDSERSRKQYTHIVYRAHYEDRCEGVHKPSEAKPYPDGCLLDPKRLTWMELRGKMLKGSTYQTVYQQEDVDEAEVLVPKRWIYGGLDRDGSHLPGCLDTDRAMGEIPKGLAPPWTSYITVDPSPTRRWAIEWWIHQKSSQYRFLIDLENRAMEAPELLEFNPVTQEYSGILDEWVRRARLMGFPVKFLIVEKNAAQRFMMQYTFFRLWTQQQKVTLRPHETTMNKLDDKLGFEAALKPVYRHGLVRLPWAAKGRTQVDTLKLIGEVTTWPGGTSDDCAMAQWFGEFHLPQMAVRDPREWPRLARPSWLSEVKDVEKMAVGSFG
jgi:hypothetical protein